MPLLFRIRKVLEARGITAFFNVGAGGRREPDSQQEIATLRLMLAEKDRKIEALQDSRERIEKQRVDADGTAAGKTMGGGPGSGATASASDGSARKSDGVGGESPPPFFIVGSGKSGTTWLMRLLNSHPEVLCRGEGRLFEKNWHRPDLRDEEARIPPRFLYGSLYHAEDLRLWLQRSVWTKAEDLEECLDSISGLVIAHVLKHRLAKSGKKIVGDKTPTASPDVIKEIHRLCPGSKVIHIIRDGRDVEVSWVHHRWNRAKDQGGIQVLEPEEVERREAYRQDPEKIQQLGFFDEGYLRARTRAWRSRIETIHGDGRELLGENYVELTYEDLLRNTALEVRGLLEFLEVGSDERTVKRCVEKASFESMSGGRQRGEEDPTSFFRKGVSGDWRNAFTEKDKRTYKEEAGDLLIKLGYEQDENW